MIELRISKFLRERESEGSVMETCYKLYTWISNAVLMLLLQIFWKVTQISDYFKEKSVEDVKPDTFTFSPLTKESKFRRHIRSMSDVQSSTPFRVPFRLRKGSTQSLAYDSDTRSRRIGNMHKEESSDSSDYLARRKLRGVEHKIIKHTDSMRIL